MLVQSALSSLFARANEVGVASTFQFLLSEQQPFWVRAPACTQVHTGMHPQADVSIAMDTSVFLAIMRRQSDIEALFAQGQLKIDGRLGLATLLPRLVSRALHAAMGTGGDEPPLPGPASLQRAISARLDMRGGIERPAARQLSVHEVTTRYRAAGKPLVLTSALDVWPLAKMSMGQTLQNFADIQGISWHGHYADHPFSSRREFKPVRVMDFGTHVANTVARRLVMAPQRPGGQTQFIPAPVAQKPRDDLASVLEWATRHADSPLTVKQLAAKALMSERTFLRRFSEATGMAPKAWLLQVRMNLARDLLESSPLSNEQIAGRCGFASAESFRAAFRKIVGLAPMTYRAQFGRH